MQIDKAAAEARLARARGASLDEILAMLRKFGLTKMQSMLVLEDHLSLGHREAKLAVHQSDVWKDQRQSAEELERQLLDSEQS